MDNRVDIDTMEEWDSDIEDDDAHYGLDDDPNHDPEKGAVLGGVGGAVVGVAAGMLAGPVGAVIGGAVGAAVGAVGSGLAVAAVDRADNDNTLTGVGDAPNPVTSGRRNPDAIDAGPTLHGEESRMESADSLNLGTDEDVAPPDSNVDEL